MSANSANHECLVYKLKEEDFRVHPNADALEIILIDGFTVVAQKGLRKPGDLVTYVPPETYVPVAHPFFDWLKKKEGQIWHLVTVKRLRGIYSQGLLTDAPEGSVEGQDVAELLGCVHYEADSEERSSMDTESDPFAHFPKYDVVALQKCVNAFEDGEEIFVTEKLHGENWRCVYHDGRLMVGSRSNWWREPTDHSSNPYWHGLSFHPEIAEAARCIPDTIFYGEVYGKNKGFPYDVPPGQRRVRLFDILDTRRIGWLDTTQFQMECEIYKLPMAPKLPIEKFNMESLREIIEANSSLAPHIREGCVVQPKVQRIHPKYGRLKCKLVSNRYLEKCG